MTQVRVIVTRGSRVILTHILQDVVQSHVALYRFIVSTLQELAIDE